jgi:hypothetical protein
MKLNWSQCALVLLFLVALAIAAFAYLPIEQGRAVATALLVFGLAGGMYVGFLWSKEASENDPESPVIIAQRPDEMQAAVIVSQLETAGIEATAVGTFTSGFQVEIASMVKIVVPRRQADQAREVLQKEQL